MEYIPEHSAVLIIRRPDVALPGQFVGYRGVVVEVDKGFVTAGAKEDHAMPWYYVDVDMPEWANADKRVWFRAEEILPL